MANPAGREKAPMSIAHKAALAEGREQGRAVRRYLEALDRSKPRRGRRRTAETVKRQLDDVTTRLETADPLSRLHLLQSRRDLEAELAHQDNGVDLTVLEADFLKAAKAYGDRKAISYAAWREAGVSATVLSKAGIGRSAHSQ